MASNSQAKLVKARDALVEDFRDREYNYNSLTVTDEATYHKVCFLKII